MNKVIHKVVSTPVDNPVSKLSKARRRLPVPRSRRRWCRSDRAGAPLVTPPFKQPALGIYPVAFAGSIGGDRNQDALQRVWTLRLHCQAVCKLDQASVSFRFDIDDGRAATGKNMAMSKGHPHLSHQSQRSGDDIPRRGAQPSSDAAISSTQGWFGDLCSHHCQDARLDLAHVVNRARPMDTFGVDEAQTMPVGSRQATTVFDPNNPMRLIGRLGVSEFDREAGKLKCDRSTRAKTQ